MKLVMLVCCGFGFHLFFFLTGESIWTDAVGLPD